MEKEELLNGLPVPRLPRIVRSRDSHSSFPIDHSSARGIRILAYPYFTLGGGHVRGFRALTAFSALLFTVLSGACLAASTSGTAASVSTSNAASASQGKAPAANDTGQTLNVRATDPPVNLDWNGLSTLLEAPLILNLCEGLYTYEYPSGKLVPGFAALLTKSKDLKEYTFKIREDAKWSDGKPIYAQDFINAWVRLVSPQSTSIYAYYLFDVVGASEYNAKTKNSPSDIGLKAVDDRTLVVKLKRPVQNWEANTAFWPLYPIRNDQIEKYGSNWWRAGVLVSSGPFVFDSYETGKKAVLKRNPYYRRTDSNVKELDFYFIADQDDALKKYDSGFFNFLWGMPFSITKKYRGRADYQTQNIMRGHLLGLNAEKFPMSNKEFRLAILSAINPQKLIPDNADQLRQGSTLIPPPLAGSERPALIAFNPKLAKEHLKRSGVIPGKSSKIRILTGISEPFNSVGKLLQTQLIKNLGLDVELAALQSQELTAYMNLGDYNATLISWTAKVVAPQDFLLPYSGEAAYNRMHFKNNFYDQWIFEGAQAKDSKTASHAFYEAQKVVAIDEAVLSPLFFETSSNLIKQNLKKVYFNHMGIPILKDVQIQPK